MEALEGWKDRVVGMTLSMSRIEVLQKTKRLCRLIVEKTDVLDTGLREERRLAEEILEAIIEEERFEAWKA